ncbi:MAG TPA: hypothetical protein VMS31_10715 [Pyrinomonadaceae bacterium]|nr:hypothetical protein [Pyrinomonadaceae bacterium]
MKKSLLLFLVVISVSAFSQVLAQPGPEQMSPPKALLIVREEIKPGMMGVHNRHSAEFASLFSSMQTPNHRIAMVPIAGNENEVIYITPLESFAELEGINQATDKKLEGATGAAAAKLERLNNEGPALHAAMRDILTVYRPELSFNPGAQIAQMRYFSITTTHVRPGFDAAYAEYVQKVINVARQKAKVDNLHVAVFQIISGAPGGTFMIFRPMKSLSELDVPIGQRVRAAMTDDQRKDADKAVREAVMSSEVSTYAFAPRMSYVPQGFASVDPTFWNPKPETAPNPRPKRRAPKPPPAQ